jgi:putative hydrolase of the HAD superfamily
VIDVLGAVTFDLWNTLIFEGSGGLIRPRSLWWQRTLQGFGMEVEVDRLDAAHEAALASYQASWRQNRQFRSPEATDAVLAHLGLEVNAAVQEQLVGCFHSAGLDCTIEIVPGAIATLRALRDLGVKTAIICDIGLTPSSALRELLTQSGVLQLIDVECWSDERGSYKPDTELFDWTVDGLGVPAAAALHVGDRLRTDVAGARAAGLVSVRFRGVYDDPEQAAEADHVIDDLGLLVDIVRETAPAR